MKYTYTCYPLPPVVCPVCSKEFQQGDAAYPFPVNLADTRMTIDNEVGVVTIETDKPLVVLLVHADTCMEAALTIDYRLLLQKMFEAKTSVVGDW